MPHLQRETFGDENVAWCDHRTYDDLASDPGFVTCVACLEAAADFGARASRRLTAIRYANAHGFDVDDTFPRTR